MSATASDTRTMPLSTRLTMSGWTLPMRQCSRTRRTIRCAIPTHRLVDSPAVTRGDVAGGRLALEHIPRFALVAAGVSLRRPLVRLTVMHSICEYSICTCMIHATAFNPPTHLRPCSRVTNEIRPHLVFTAGRRSGARFAIGRLGCGHQRPVVRAPILSTSANVTAGE